MALEKNHSTESALILMIDTWLKVINEGKQVGCAMIDFCEAFDLVDHQLLLKKTTYLSVQWYEFILVQILPKYQNPTSGH